MFRMETFANAIHFLVYKVKKSLHNYQVLEDKVISQKIWLLPALPKTFRA